MSDLLEDVLAFARNMRYEVPTHQRTARLVIPGWLADQCAAEGLDVDELATVQARRMGFAGATVEIVR